MHTAAVWKVRAHPNVIQSFATILGEDDLIASLDVISLFRPWALSGTENWRTRGGWWHADQRPQVTLHLSDSNNNSTQAVTQLRSKAATPHGELPHGGLHREYIQVSHAADLSPSHSDTPGDARLLSDVRVMWRWWGPRARRVGFV